MIKKSGEKAITIISIVGFCWVVFGIFCSCAGTSLGEDDLLRVEDTIPPVIRLTSPSEGAFFASSLLLEGTVTDAAGSDGTPGNPGSRLNYRFLGTSLAGSLLLDNKGRFRQMLSTTDITHDIILRLQATDWNGQSIEKRISLTKNSFPRFELTSGNRQVILGWDSPENDAVFNVYCLEGEGRPAEDHCDGARQDARPGVVFENLENGKLYSFLVEACTDNGARSVSEVKHAIPLSPFTLLPETTSGYQVVGLRWKDAPGAGSYRIKRASHPEGPYSVLRGQVQGTVYTDSTAEAGRNYYYTIQPEIPGAVESHPAWGRTSLFPDSCEPMTTLALRGAPARAALGGDYLYVASLFKYPFGGVQVLDISQPADPVLLREIELSGRGNTSGLCVTGEALFLAREDDWVYMYSLADPARPQFMRQYYTGEEGETEDVVTAGDYLYAADGFAGLDIFSLTNQAQEQLPVASFSLVPPHSPQPASALAREGHYLYVTLARYGSNPGAFLVCDIADPLAPLFYGPFASPLHPMDPRDLVIRDERLYLAGGQMGLLIYDVHDPRQPVYLGGIDPGDYLCGGVSLCGNYVCLAADTGGLFVVNACDPTAPVLCGGFRSPVQSAGGVASNNRYAFLTDFDQGLLCFDLTAPAPAATSGRLPGSAAAGDVSFYGDYLYAAAGDRGMMVWDLSQPESPVLLGTVPTRGKAMGVYTAGGYAFVTGEEQGVEVFVLDQPGLPGLWAYSGNAGRTTAVAITAEYALVCGEADGPALSVFSLGGGGGELTREAVCVLEETPVAIAVRDTRALVPLTGGGVAEVDLAHLPEIRGVARTMAWGEVEELAFRGESGCAALKECGFRTFAAVDLKETGSLLLPASPFDLVLEGRYAFLAAGRTGICVVDWNDPAAPLMAGEYDTNGETRGVALKGRFLYAVTVEGAVERIEIVPGL